MLRILGIICRAGVVATLATPVLAAGAQIQASDPDFDASVERPAYPSNGPVVVIDEAHANFHTAAGRYQPFADLLRNDGYTVVAGKTAFDPDVLNSVDVLVISNALPPAGAAPGTPALTQRESDSVQDWVREGGSLLLVADHAPFGSAAENLGRRFGVTMGKGWVWDFRDSGASIATRFVSSRENGLLGSHPLLRGRDMSEEVTILKAFSGQSLGVPAGATVLMKLSDTAREAHNRADLETIRARSLVGRRRRTTLSESSHTLSGGRAQGIALVFGQGRIVVLGEAAMLSAQVTTMSNPPGTTRAGN